MLSTYVMPRLSIRFLMTTLHVFSKVERIIYACFVLQAFHRLCGQELPTSSNLQIFVTLFSGLIWDPQASLCVSWEKPTVREFLASPGRVNYTEKYSKH